MRISSRLAGVGLAVSMISGLGSSAYAQGKLVQPAVAQGSPQISGLTVPPASTLVLLIRLSLLTLNDAILTGNYSVLRERGGLLSGAQTPPLDLRAFLRRSKRSVPTSRLSRRQLRF